MTLEPAARLLIQRRGAIEEGEAPALAIEWRGAGQSGGAAFDAEIEASLDDEEGDSTEATFRIWNMSRDLFEDIEPNGFLQLDAGWLTEGFPQKETAFYGQIRSTHFERSGGERILEIEATTSGPRYEQLYVPLRRSEDNVDNLIRDIVSSYGGKVEFMAADIEKVVLTDYVTTRPVWQELTGLVQTASDLLGRRHQILRVPTAPFTVAIIDAERAKKKKEATHRVLGPIDASNEFVFRAVPVVEKQDRALSFKSSFQKNKDEGGENAKGADNESAANRYEMTMLFHPHASLGLHVNVTNAPNGPGRFVADEVTHRIGGRGQNAWETDLAGPTEG